MVGTTCIKNLICEDGTYKSTTLNTCEKCEIPHCSICTDAETCTVCDKGFELKDRFCLSNGSIETVYDGITLQTPFSITYNIQHEIKLNQYDTFNKAANTLSILSWIRDLGTRFTLNPSDESTIYSFSTDQIIFVFLLITVVVIVGALTFFPALTLGPVVEHFLMKSGQGF